jgi:RNA polymerase sigma factor (sigma-70 family)
MPDDVALLRRYAEDRDEAAFAELVRRRLDGVYSMALRRTGGDTHLAQDVAQQVFLALARDAGRLSGHPGLTGWLYLTTRYAAASAVRRERRRKHREQEAHAMEEAWSNGPPDAEWNELAPVLEDALDELGDADQLAVLLRFIERRSFAEIGAALRLTEEAARKRVDRALDKLHVALGRRGIVSTATALTAALTRSAVSAAPSGLAATVTGAALGSIGVATGALAIMGLTKLQIGIATVVVCGGIVGLVSQQHVLRTLRESNAQLQAQVAVLTSEKNEFAKVRAPAADDATALRREVAALKEQRPATDAPKNNPAAMGAGQPLPSPPDTPENRQRKAKYHERYDPFFAERGYTPSQIERIMDLWILQDTAREDVQAAVRQTGTPGDAPGIEDLRAKLTGPILRELQEIMGDEGYSTYNRYQLTSMFRMGYVSRMLPAFAAAGAAASDAQVDQIVTVMTTSFGTKRTDPTSIGTQLRVDWEAVAQKSRGFLSPAQQSVLQTFIAQEKAGGR